MGGIAPVLGLFACFEGAEAVGKGEAAVGAEAGRGGAWAAATVPRDGGALLCDGRGAACCGAAPSDGPAEARWMGTGEVSLLGVLAGWAGGGEARGVVEGAGPGGIVSFVEGAVDFAFPMGLSVDAPTSSDFTSCVGLV